MGFGATQRKRYFLTAFKRGAKQQQKQTGFPSIGYEGGVLATLVIPGQAAPNLATGEDGLRALAMTLSSCAYVSRHSHPALKGRAIRRKPLRG